MGSNNKDLTFAGKLNYLLDKIVRNFKQNKKVPKCIMSVFKHQAISAVFH